MEFEIDDCDRLFDASTNPSLLRRPRPPAIRKAAANRDRQKAIIIPEEEELTA